MNVANAIGMYEISMFATVATAAIVIVLAFIAYFGRQNDFARDERSADLTGSLLGLAAFGAIPAFGMMAFGAAILVLIVGIGAAIGANR